MYDEINEPGSAATAGYSHDLHIYETELNILK